MALTQVTESSRAAALSPAAFGPFADPLIFLFIGSFILSRAVVEHGLDRRIAAGILSVPGVGVSFAGGRCAIAVVTVLISAWMSNMVVTAMMLPVTLGLVAAQTGSPPRPDKLTTGLLLVMGFAASIGGMITPVGAAPNLITIGLLDQATGSRIGFLTWTAVCLPIAAVLTMVLLAVGMRQFPVTGRGDGCGQPAVPASRRLGEPALHRSVGVRRRRSTGERFCCRAAGSRSDVSCSAPVWPSALRRASWR